MGVINLSPPWPHSPRAEQRSYWLGEALGREHADGRSPALEGDASYDILIVGGGFTGLWTALEIIERAPGTSICLIEADVCGGGASGANAGMLMNLWPKFLSLLALCPTDEAVWLARASEAAVEDVMDFVDEHDLDVGLRSVPFLWSAENAAQRGAWSPTLQAIDRLTPSPLAELDGDQARALAGTEHVFGGVIDRTCATLQLAALARALRGVALDRGVVIAERTPLRRLHQADVGALAVTSNARIRADRVILAINAWAAELEDIGRRMVMVASDNLVTASMTQALTALDWEHRSAISDARRRLNYYRTLPDGQVLVGKGGIAVGFGARAARTLWGPALRMSEMRRALTRQYPRLIDAPVVADWTAPVEYSVSSLPFCGQLREVPAAMYATGYSGDGVGPSRMIARILASRALSTEDEWSSCALATPPLAKLPPEPARYLGARLVVPALAAAERREDLGQPVPALLRRIADIDPTSFAG